MLLASCWSSRMSSSQGQECSITLMSLHSPTFKASNQLAFSHCSTHTKLVVSWASSQHSPLWSGFPHTARPGHDMTMSTEHNNAEAFSFTVRALQVSFKHLLELSYLTLGGSCRHSSNCLARNLFQILSTITAITSSFLSILGFSLTPCWCSCQCSSSGQCSSSCQCTPACQC